METSHLRAELARFHGDSFGWALHCCDFDRSEAEDVLQTAYVKALEGKAVYAGKASFKTWLFGVIRRTARERRRRRALRFDALKARFTAAAFVETDSETPEILHERSEDSARLVRALKRLSPRQREALHLVFYQGFSIEEAAAAMGVGLGSARVHYQRGKRQLRRLLGEGGQ